MKTNEFYNPATSISLEGSLKSVRESITAHDIFKIFKLFSAAIGLPHFIVITGNGAGVRNESRSYVLTNFPNPVLNFCIENDLFGESRFFQRLQDGALPLAGSISEYLGDTPGETEALKYIVDSGIDSFTCVPVKGPHDTEARILYGGNRPLPDHAEMAEIAYLSMHAFNKLQFTLGEEVSAEKNPLTPRETDCLRLSATGLSAREVAAALDMAVHTVNYHIANATVKTRAKNKTHAVAEAIRHGWLNQKRSSA
ncbi:LuxR C-terminal-related transcriptional regulator [Oricola sp.]|uniref:helix-turn-helix transcriptional regulator n=1 Tax=Oricola sp. TaxID=1979950 RepID=UPI003BAA535E